MNTYSLEFQNLNLKIARKLYSLDHGKGLTEDFQSWETLHETIKTDYLNEAKKMIVE